MPDTPKFFYLSFLLLLNIYCIIVTMRFRLIKNTGRHLLPKVYINPNDFLSEPSYSGKIKVSVRKITSTFSLSSGVAQQISEHVGKNGNRLGWFYHRKVSDDPNVWLETENYILTVREKKILLSDTDWLNDSKMDALKVDW